MLASAWCTCRVGVHMDILDPPLLLLDPLIVAWGVLAFTRCSKGSVHNMDNSHAEKKCGMGSAYLHMVVQVTR